MKNQMAENKAITKVGKKRVEGNLSHPFSVKTGVLVIVNSNY